MLAAEREWSAYHRLLKANGAKMQFGSAGAGSTTHLACSLLNSTIGVDITHVPYRGGLLAMQIRWQLAYPGKPMPFGLPEAVAWIDCRPR